MAVNRDPLAGVSRTLTGYVTDLSFLVSAQKLSVFPSCGISDRLHRPSHRQSRVAT